MPKTTHVTRHRDDGTNERLDVDTRPDAVRVAVDLLKEYGVPVRLRRNLLTGQSKIESELFDNSDAPGAKEGNQ